MIREVERKTIPGFPAFLGLLALTALDIYLLVVGVQSDSDLVIALTIIAFPSSSSHGAASLSSIPMKPRSYSSLESTSAQFAIPGCGTPTPFTPK